MELEEAGELLDVALADAAPVGADRAADEVAIGLGLDGRRARFGRKPGLRPDSLIGLASSGPDVADEDLARRRAPLSAGPRGGRA
jgi:hypothetical protein